MADLQPAGWSTAPDYRAAGILLHITSLPTPYGIGDLGPAAIHWVDRLSEAGQTWWQTLPLGPTGLGNSPYNALSSFAGNPLLISPDRLIEEGLLAREECGELHFPPGTVDFGAVYPLKQRLLAKAWENFRRAPRADLQSAFHAFCCTEASWLDDFALFMAIKERQHGAYYLDWPAPLVHREPAALAAVRQELAGPIDEVRFVQFLFFRQSDQLRAHCRLRGVSLMGDLPFYVSPDSADVWADPHLFQLDEHRRPRLVGGCPPDYFAPQGQYWGNPVYDWDELRRTGYQWWLARLQATLRHVDLLRLDHFRGFGAAWLIPAGSPTAESGAWVPGPGVDFFATVQEKLGGLPLVAEDLGLITPDVKALADKFHLPGMRVMQFAFDGLPDNPHRADAIIHNCVVYTGTHDNDTTRGWFDSLDDWHKDQVRHYVGNPHADGAAIAGELLRMVWQTRAALAIAPWQDWLRVDGSGRMNIPGRADGNWTWRCRDDQLSTSTFEELRKLTADAHRWRR